MAKVKIKWDHYFAQWCKHWLPFLGLLMEEKPRFSQLPLEADVLVIHPETRPEPATALWQAHPIWRHVSPYTVVEFKSIRDDFTAVDWGKLLAYVGLTMERQQLGLETEIAGWLVVPYINRTLRRALRRDRIVLETVLPGFHRGRTSFFPLAIVEYDRLPLEAPYLEFKSFMRSGAELRQVMRLALGKWLGESGFLYEEYSTIITSLHAEEAQKVIEVLEQDLPKIKGMMNKLASMLGDEVRELDFVRDDKREAARRMKADGMAIEQISKYTGLGLDEIETL